MASPLAFLCATILIPLISALPQQPTSTPAPEPNENTKGWSKGKIGGLVAGCVVGGAIILFLWGWVLKGSKMFQGEKIMFLRAHFGFSKESREEAKRARLEIKRRKEEERKRIWGERALTKEEWNARQKERAQAGKENVHAVQQDGQGTTGETAKTEP